MSSRRPRSRPAHRHLRRIVLVLVAVGVAGGVVAPTTAHATERITPEDLFASLPGPVDLRALGGTWHQGPAHFDTGLRPGSAADPEVRVLLRSAGTDGSVASLTATVGEWRTPPEALVAARTSLAAGAQPATIDGADHAWRWAADAAADRSCSVVAVWGPVVTRLTLRRNGSPPPTGPTASTAATTAACTADDRRALDATAATVLERAHLAERGERRVPRLAPAWTDLLPTVPLEHRMLGTVRQAPAAVAIGESAEDTAWQGRFEQERRLLAAIGVRSTVARTWSVERTALTAVALRAARADGARRWVDALGTDRSDGDRRTEVSVPGADRAREEQRRTGARGRPADWRMRVARGAIALELRCTRPFGPSGTPSACIDVARRAARDWAVA